MTLQDVKGSSRQAIKKTVLEKNKITDSAQAQRGLKTALEKGVKSVPLLIDRHARLLFSDFII